jgi:hypothetical protein
MRCDIEGNREAEEDGIFEIVTASGKASEEASFMAGRDDDDEVGDVEFEVGADAAGDVDEGEEDDDIDEEPVRAKLDRRAEVIAAEADSAEFEDMTSNMCFNYLAQKHAPNCLPMSRSNNKMRPHFA